MSDTPRATPGLSAAPESDAPEYRSISVSAVLSFLFGLGAATAVLAPAFWAIPAAGLVCSLFALCRIAASDQPMIGRKAAIAGLLLSVLFAVAGPTDWLWYRWMLRGEARQFANYWFGYLRDRDPIKAYELTVPPERRDPLDGTLPQHFAAGSKRRSQLEEYVATRLVDTLLTLGDRARVRYWDTEWYLTGPVSESLGQVYAVTYDTDQGPRSFFVRLILQKTFQHGSRYAYWTVEKSDGGVRPEGWADQPAAGNGQG